MKKSDWLIAGAFIFMGLSCFVMSLTLIDHSESVHAFLMGAVDICLWVGLPLTIIGLLYLWRRRRNGK